MESPRETLLPRLFVLVCAVAHPGAPVGGLSSGPRAQVRLRGAANRKTNAGLKYLCVRLQSHFSGHDSLTTISCDARRSERRNAFSADGIAER
jgi:hypothetical protein